MRYRVSCILCVIVLFTAAFVGCGRRDAAILLIGVDGASWKIIDPLINAGALPHIRALKETGCSGTIRTLLDRTSPVIWTSIATGKLPRKHGIEGYTTFDPARDDGVLSRSFHRKVKAVWTILSERHRTAGVFNWMITYPPEKVNGFMVSDFYLAPSSGMITTSPAGLRARLPALPPRAAYPQVERYDLLCDTTVSVSLYRKHTVDLFACYTGVIDHICHGAWGNTGGPVITDTVQDYYRAIDAWIGDLLRHRGRNTIVILVSDHGFKSTDGPLPPEVVFSRIVRIMGMSQAVTSFRADKENYVATTLTSRQFARLLSRIRLPGGAPVFTALLSDRPEFTYRLKQSPALSYAQTARIVIDGHSYPVSQFLRYSFSARFSGTHDYHDGIFIMQGPHIPAGRTVDTAAVTDITPTILYFLGLPVARDMDGTVLTSCIAPAYLARRPVTYIDTYETAPAPGAGTPPLTTPYDDDVKRKLRSLGYLQ